MAAQQKVSSFLRLGPREVFERDYYITHTTRRRFPAGVIVLIFFGLVFYLLPGIILILYFSLRRLKISHGYAAITNERLVYYEFNDHPAENYQHVTTLHLSSITAIEFVVRRTFLTNSFQMTFYTEKAGLRVGAKKFIGLLTLVGSTKVLEPGPDALQFIQEMSGAIAARRFLVGPTSTATP